jgi:hypothetical protein
MTDTECSTLLKSKSVSDFEICEDRGSQKATVDRLAELRSRFDAAGQKPG